MGIYPSQLFDRRNSSHVEREGETVPPRGGKGERTKEDDEAEFQKKKGSGTGRDRGRCADTRGAINARAVKWMSRSQRSRLVLEEAQPRERGESRASRGTDETCGVPSSSDPFRRAKKRKKSRSTGLKAGDYMLRRSESNVTAINFSGSSEGPSLRTFAFGANGGKGVRKDVFVLKRKKKCEPLTRRLPRPAYSFPGKQKKGGRKGDTVLPLPPPPPQPRPSRATMARR